MMMMMMMMKLEWMDYFRQRACCETEEEEEVEVEVAAKVEVNEESFFHLYGLTGHAYHKVKDGASRSS